MEHVAGAVRFRAMSESTIGRHLTDLGTLTSRPWAFLIVILYGGLWLLLWPESLDAHGVVTLIVWAMTLFIQRAQHRDTQALHAKLDELLRVEDEARNELMRIDQEEPERIEEHRAAGSDPG